MLLVKALFFNSLLNVDRKKEKIRGGARRWRSESKHRGMVPAAVRTPKVFCFEASVCRAPYHHDLVRPAPIPCANRSA